MEWTEIGTFGVDSGLCWIGDPCYLSDVRGPMKDWPKFCESLGNKDYMQFEEGIACSTAYGDGEYSVEARIENNRVMEIRIKFA